MVNIRSNYGGGSSGGDPVKWFRGKVARIEDGAEKALQDAMDDGAYLMADLISTRGTPKSGKAGRIETKQMHNEVDSRVQPYGQGKVRGTFGWINNKEDYYGYQEGGFDHSNGSHVEGMYALADAADWALRQFQEDMRQVVKDA